VSIHDHPEHAEVREKMERIYHKLRAQYGVE
jgi:hypothetical protein